MRVQRRDLPYPRPTSTLLSLLAQHAAAASTIAKVVESVELELVRFAADPQQTAMLASTMRLVERAEGLRAALVDEVARACRLALDLERPRPAQRTAVLIAAPSESLPVVPHPRRLPEAC